MNSPADDQTVFETVLAALNTHRPSASRFCTECRWTPPHYNYEDSQLIRVDHAAQVVTSALREAGLLRDG